MNFGFLVSTLSNPAAEGICGVNLSSSFCVILCFKQTHVIKPKNEVSCCLWHIPWFHTIQL